MRPALALVRWWIRVYTAGLPTEMRDDRRAELESDLWEQRAAAAALGADGFRVTMSIGMRWLLGMPDDLAWRAEQLAEARHQAREDRRRQGMQSDISRGRLVRLGAGVGVAVALVLLIVVINTIQFSEGRQPSGQDAALLLMLAVAMAVLGIAVAAGGFSVMAARPTEGAVLVIGGSTVAGLAWYWLFVPVIAAVIVSIYGVGRAMRIAQTNPKA